MLSILLNVSHSKVRNGYSYKLRSERKRARLREAKR